jgi:hypothetical protein
VLQNAADDVVASMEHKTALRWFRDPSNILGRFSAGRAASQVGESV